MARVKKKCQVRPEQDSNRKEKANKKMGGLWTKKGQFTWLCFHFGVFVFLFRSYDKVCFTWLLLILNVIFTVHVAILLDR